MSSSEQIDLARWIVRLSAKGEASTRGGDLRRLALVNQAKGVAEVQLYRQQTRSWRRESKKTKINRPRLLKRSHSVTPASSGAFAAACVCAECNLCSNYRAAGANACYCKALGYVTTSGAPIQSAIPQTDGSTSPAGSSFDEDEESKLIDDFLSSLDGVPSKKCKRTL